MSTVLVLGGPDGGGTVKVLLNAGVEVLEAERAVDGLELARDRRPDLLIVAGGIAGIEGDEFTLAMRSDPVIRETPVVFCGPRQVERELWLLSSICGVSRVLIEPYAPDELLRLIGGLLSPR
jgi:DNA-binding response OmpR family regulator